MTITGGNAEAREQHQRRRQARAAAGDEPQRKRARLQTRAVLARLARAQEERLSAGGEARRHAGAAPGSDPGDNCDSGSARKRVRPNEYGGSYHF